TTLGALLDGLKAGVPADTYAGALAAVSSMGPAQIERIVAHLRQMGAVVEAPEQADQTEPPVYRRQVEFFDLFETQGVTGLQLNERLRNRRVVVVGVGGFGTWIALYLSRIGVKHIIAVDPDRIEESNLSRQVLYRRSDVGRLKVDVVGERVKDSDPDIRFDGHPMLIQQPEDLSPLIQGADLVFNPFGYLPSRTREAVAVACMSANVPFLLCGSNIVGPLCVPGETACYRCLMDHDPTMTAAMQTLQANRWLPPQAPFAPMLAVTSAYAVWEAGRFLSGCDRPHTLNGLYTLDPLNYAVTFQQVERQPGCRLCDPTPTQKPR
ncbi:MAG TPA: ThiF family adenylyltransferase, partial [Symbiobacteriaceae bacterium]|nr:ThiF family adenylyltransferase [Symbiobacteriaceae bacterium]